MPNFARGLLAVLAGLLAGGVVNMVIVVLGPMLIPPPAGVDPSDVESLRTSIHLFEPRHFLSPFLAHALGTLVGALVAALIACSYKLGIGLGVGVVNLAGGIAASVMIPAPAWFIAADLLLAYLPMAWLGVKLGSRIRAGEAKSQ